ncbi:MAG TPA: hypothetical protein VFB31_14740 [Pseudolabrys sp.]|nr:hypothetical protein [Pseudolabrys sp.]
MLVVEVKLVPDGIGALRVLARAIAGNVTDLADRSDYRIAANEGANPIAGTPAWEAHGHILGHDRVQSVWALVAKLAAWAAAEAEKRP